MTSRTTDPTRRRIPIIEQPAAQLLYEPDTEEVEEEDCLRRLLAAHLPPHRICPECGSVDADYIRLPGTLKFECRDCGHKINPTTGTPFFNSPVQFRTWKRVCVYLYSSPLADLALLPKHVRLERGEAVVVRSSLRACDHPAFWLRLLSPLLRTSDVIDNVSMYDVPGAKRPPLIWHR